MADIKDKIAKLLALAESPNENEAKAALLQARALMAKHKLRPEECQKAENVQVVRELVGVRCTRMTNPWAAALASIIAEHYCCRAYTTRFSGKKINEIGLVGLEDDFAVAEQVYLYAYDCIISHCKHEIKADSLDPPGTRRERCNAYGAGFCKGLHEAFREQTAQNQEWGLVLIVPKEVDDSMRDMGKGQSWGGKINREHAEDTLNGYSHGKAFDPTHRIGSSGDAPALIGG